MVGTGKQKKEVEQLEIITIDKKELELKEWQGQRVLTAWDIAKVHNRDIKVITQQFKRNQNNLVLGVDFFLIDKEILKSQFVTSNEISNKANNLSEEIPLFTETGYLMLTKTFKDKLSWDIQRMLVNTYFSTRELARLQSELMRQKQREIGKQARKRETESIKMLNEYIKEQHGNIDPFIYSNYTKMSYKALKNLLDYEKDYKVNRNLLSEFELVELYEIEKIIDSIIVKSIIKKVYYKDIYYNCNNELNEYVIQRKAVLKAIKTVVKSTNKNFLIG